MTTALAVSDLDTGPIPDLVEPLEAWRVWRVGMLQGRVVLKSLFVGAVWEPAIPLAATCSQRHRPRLRPWRLEPSGHAPPEMSCRCGIYGVQSVIAARSYLERPDLLCRGERVIGRVALWGNVVEGELGWRASRAYPIELFVPAPAVVRSGLRRRAYMDEILQSLEEYMVPVDVVEPNVLAAL